jgi:hypothetical protein
LRRLAVVDEFLAVVPLAAGSFVSAGRKIPIVPDEKSPTPDKG